MLSNAYVLISRELLTHGPCFLGFGHNYLSIQFWESLKGFATLSYFGEKRVVLLFSKSEGCEMHQESSRNQDVVCLHYNWSKGQGLIELHAGKSWNMTKDGLGSPTVTVLNSSFNFARFSVLNEYWVDWCNSIYAERIRGIQSFYWPVGFYWLLSELR